MPPPRATRSGGQSTNPTDINSRQSDNPLSLQDEWYGDDMHRGPWLRKRTRAAETNHTFRTLCESATVTNSRGQVAVYSVAHAKEHLEGRNRGTFLEPNMRARENLAAGNTQSPSAPGATTHGGYPTPSPTANTAAAQTYASAVTTSGSGRVLSQLEAELGQHASNYVIAPGLIEEADHSFLANFTDHIANERLCRQWQRQTLLEGQPSGRNFIKMFLEDMDGQETSMTTEHTVQSKMDLIQKAGLSEATMDCFLATIEEFELWNDTLNIKVPEPKLAFIYRSWVGNLSREIKISLDLKIATLEARAAAKGRDAAKDDPVGLVTKAATTVLNDIENEAMTKAIESGRAYVASSGFDPRRAPGGQTWATNSGGGGGPEKWVKDMRLCLLCPAGTPDHAKEHLDRQCKHATPEKLEELKKMLTERRSKARAAWEKKKKEKKAKNGGAALASAPAAEPIDKLDEQASATLFNSDGPIVLDLDNFAQGAPRALVAKGATSISTATSTATSTTIASTTSPSPLPSVTEEEAPTGNSKVAVLFDGGNTEENELISGVYIGDFNVDVAPHLKKVCHENQLVFNKKEFKSRTRRVTSLVTAVDRCERYNIPAIYRGPFGGVPGLDIGDNVADYLDGGDDSSSDASSEPAIASSSSDSSDAELDDGVEVPVQETLSTPTPAATTTTRTSDDRLDALAREVEGIDINTHMDTISDLIKREKLDVSPATGGSNARTKFQVINEMREIIGSDPLPVEVLLRRKSRPTPKPPTPMGRRVDTELEGTDTPTGMVKVVKEHELPRKAEFFRNTGKYHLYYDCPPDGSIHTYAVNVTSDRGSSKLDFGSPLNPNKAQANAAETPPPPPRQGATGLVLVFMLAQMVMMLMALAMHPDARAGAAATCRMLAPGWVCSLPEYIALPASSAAARSSPPLTPRGDATTPLPRALAFSSDSREEEPGDLHTSWGRPGAWHGGASTATLLLPTLVCMVLTLHSLGLTVYFALAQASRLGKGLGRPQGPPRDTTPRHARRPPPRGSTRARNGFASSSYFCSTLGEAPLWLSICMLAIEIGTSVVPGLAALSIRTLAAHTLRGIVVTLCGVLGSWVMTPVRFALRFTVNTTVLGTYLAACLVMRTTTSRHPFVSAADLHRRPYLAVFDATARRGPCLPAMWRTAAWLSCTLWGATTTLAARAIGSDLSRCGGAASSVISSQSPAETDPMRADYTLNELTKPPPRKLHAFNPSKLTVRRRRSLSEPKPKPTALPKTTNGEQGKSFLSSATKLTSQSLKTLICWAVIDSGCSWHCHPHAEDLINTRPCSDTMTGIDGKPQAVKCIGDLPALARDHLGTWRPILIRNVRCVPTFSDTLISVDQFWQDSHVDTVFNNVRSILVPAKGDLPAIDLPFERREHLYKWAFVPTRKNIVQNDTSTGGERNNTQAFKATIHRPQSTSFFNALPPSEALELLHRRLHIGYDLIRKLGQTSQDIPSNIVKGLAQDCAHCKAANATRLPHSGKKYAPSHVGRLIHGDLAGPFKRSTHGFLYFLVLVDDHSRYKHVYFLKTKSEAPAKIRAFVAKLNALVNVGRAEPIKVVGQLHMDNAGEFLSKEFTEYLESETIDRTTCPPHVHSLNGVAERAIRSIMEVARATREASNCPVGFWPHLVEHAVDVLNRTTGPPRVDESAPPTCSYTMVTGLLPKILTILPLGCRAYAVKPPTAYSKSGFESKAWAGINLGRSTTIPGAYVIWLPSEDKFVQTSEVYFDEGLYPWRPNGDQRIGTTTPVAAPPPDVEDVTVRAPPAATTTQPKEQTKTTPPSSVPEAFARATKEAAARANDSMRVLLLFSGPYHRPDGLAQFLRQLGLEVEMLDNDARTGGGNTADLLRDEVYEPLRERVARGEFAVIVAAPPCSTFSISRFFESPDSKDGGPPPVRNRSNIEGLRFVPTSHRPELERANNIVARMAALLMYANRAGTQFIVENPADRGDATQADVFLHADHGPLWLMPAIHALSRHAATKLVTFAMCAFGAEWQKMTTLMYTAGLDEWLDVLDQRQCEHTNHTKMAGGEKNNGNWNSHEAAAYPPDFNNYLAQAIAAYVRQRRTRLAPKPRTLDDLTLQNTVPISEKASRPPPVALAPPPPKPTAASPNEPSTALRDAVERATVAATEATSIRKLSFDDGPAYDDAEEAIVELEADPEPPMAPMPRPTRKRVTYEKTAGARATRSQNAVTMRGLGTSAGFAMLALGSSISDAVHAMGTIDLTDELSNPLSSLSAALAKPSSADPKSQSEAYSSDRAGWRASEQKELTNHESNGSWEWVDAKQLPRGRRLVKLVWVYKVKRDGSKKSRLCVQGCRQVPGVDYDQTWCGAMRGTSLRVLSNLAANSGMRMRRFDFVAAYLQGELLEGETVYCYPPPGYERPGQICRICKPVYGMAQAGRRWQRTLFPWLSAFGFKQTHSDQSVFTLERTMRTPDGDRRERIHVGVYVDDLAIVYLHDDKHSLFHSFISALEGKWKVEDEGELTDLLGIEFTRGDHVIELKQPKYIEKLTAEFFPDGVPTSAQQNKVPCDRDLPALVNLALLTEVAPEAALLRRYQSLCGALLYASTNTRPDIAFSTGLLCRAMGKPTPELYQAALRVLAYLYRTRHLGLRYEGRAGSKLVGFSDSDWGVRHSTSGHTFDLGSATISWASKKQPSVALSSCEAEIMAGSEAAKEAIYLSAFLRELGFDMAEPPPLHMDNKSAIDLAYNPEHHARTKHIDRRHYFIRECVEEGKLRVPFVATADNVADFFTKPLMGKDFFRMRDRVMNVAHSDRLSP